jgi:hypothetical protein
VSDDCLSSVSSLFVVGGKDFDPDLFSNQVGVKPTRIWHCGLESLKERQDIPKLEWQYELARRPHTSLDKAVREILAPFVDKGEHVVGFLHAHDCSACVICRVHGDSSHVELCVESETVQLLAKVQCTICFAIEG